MSQSKLFVHGHIYIGSGVLEGGACWIKDGKIAGVYADTDKAMSEVADQTDHVIDLEGRQLLPGFIDLHVHGGGGFDVMDASIAAIDGMSRFHASHGTTAFLPTTVTADMDTTLKVIGRIVEAIDQGTGGAVPIGIHLEGPFLNPKRSGAQNPAFMQAPNTEAMDDMLRAANGNLRLMTIAPELPGACELIRYAVWHGVAVSIGHSDATYAEALEAVRFGASHVTHLFNGMRPFHHREPGVAGAGLMRDELTVECICDGHHVAFEIISYLFQTKTADRLIFVTDAVRAAGMPDGDQYDLGGLACYKKDGQIRLISTDALAGSCLTMDQALRNVVSATGLPLEQVLPAFTATPARQIGVLSHKGTIAPGKDADLVIMDENLQVQATYVKGNCVHTQHSAFY